MLNSYEVLVFFLKNKNLVKAPQTPLKEQALQDTLEEHNSPKHLLKHWQHPIHDDRKLSS